MTTARPHNIVTKLTLLLLITISILLFFYRLSWGSLAAWDEAWYAEIGRYVTQGHWLYLQSHFQLYVDHPPLGYWLIGLSQFILGESSFSARAPMALIGVGSVVLIYLTGRRLGNYLTGVVAACVLLSSRWFVLRVRTGNLDSLLVFTQLLVFYLAYRARTQKDLAWLFLAFSLSLLTKSLISITLIPIVIWSAYKVLLRHNSTKIKSIYKTLGLTLLSLTPVLVWYLLMYGQMGSTLFERLGQVVLRGESSFGLAQLNPLYVLNLIQALIHRWYKPLILSLFFGLVFIRYRASRWALTYLALVSWPYFVSTQTKIWHLLPLTPGITLIIGLATSQIITLIVKFKPKFTQTITFLTAILVISYGGLTLWEIRSEIIPTTNQRSDQEILGSALREYPGPVYLAAFTDHATAVLYYADRPIVYLESDQNLEELYTQSRPFSVITTQEMNHIKNCRLILQIHQFQALHCQ